MAVVLPSLVESEPQEEVLNLVDGCCTENVEQRLLVEQCSLHIPDFYMAMRRQMHSVLFLQKKVHK